jgi:valyl-tRNA synthetase
VLDTWFSSWLWPFSTFGWPEEKPDLKYFYPGDALVTAHEIIFFWVARMIMAGIEFMGDVPFRHVYFTGIVRDAQGLKMSKSRGNGIDPLVMVEKYSADAVRFSLMMLSSEGNDVNLADKDFEIGRNFTNKVWNVYRFLASYLEPAVIEPANENAIKKFFSEQRFELVDRWMLSRFSRGIERLTAALENFHFQEAVDTAYTLFWRDYCDWYLELIKPRLNGDDPAAKQVAATTATFLLKGLLKLLHPFVPFITEAIWQEIGRSESESIMISSWPQPMPAFVDDAAERDFALLQELISAIRNIRGEMNVPVGKTAEVLVSGNGQHAEIISGNSAYFKHLARVSSIQCHPDLRRPKLAASAVVKNLELFVPLAGLIDVKVERGRLEKERVRLEKLLESLNTRLHSHEFLAKAPEEVVTRERQKKSELEVSLEKVVSNLARLAE